MALEKLSLSIQGIRDGNVEILREFRVREVDFDQNDRNSTGLRLSLISAKVGGSLKP